MKLSSMHSHAEAGVPLHGAEWVGRARRCRQNAEVPADV